MSIIAGMATSKLVLLSLPSPTIILSIMNPLDTITLRVTFPSLFLALDYLKEGRYKAALLLGLVSHIAYVLILPRVLCVDIDTHLAHIRGHAAAYLMNSTACRENEAWLVVDIDETASVVRVIHDFYVLIASPIQSPSSSAVSMSTEQWGMVGNIERMYVDIVYKVMAENFHSSDYQCTEMLVLQWGWDDGKLLLS
jgi:hypothetical protein